IHTQPPTAHTVSSKITTPPMPTPFPYTTLFRSDGKIGPRRGFDLGEQVARERSLELHALVAPDEGDVALVLDLDAQFPKSPHNRSEEHTSELQSRENLVCRLLLEKNKKHQQVPL